MKWNITLGILVSFAFPSVCLAHSGNLVRATMNFMPFLAPLLAASLAALRDYFQKKK